jgi:hypothetical protein
VEGVRTPKTEHPTPNTTIRLPRLGYRGIEMDCPLRTRLLAALMGVVALTAVLTILAGSFLIDRMVIGEAQRRVDLALRNARAMLARRGEEAQRPCTILAKSVGPSSGPSALEELRLRGGYDFLHVVNPDGTIVAIARGRALGHAATESAVLTRDRC